MPSRAFNTVLYAPDHLPDALEEVAAAGYDGIELQPHFTLPLIEGSAADRARFAAELNDRGLRLSATMSGYLRDRQTLSANLSAASLAKELGGGHIILLPPQPSMCGWDEFAGLLGELVAGCGDLGVAVAVHHHAGTIVDTPERIERFADELAGDGVGLCFDVAHYALFADDEVEAARRLGGAIDYVHLKDLVRRHGELEFVPGVRNAQQSFRVYGDGVLDLDGVLGSLRDGGYQGWLSVEVENFYRSRTDSAARSLAAIKEADE